MDRRSTVALVLTLGLSLLGPLAVSAQDAEPRKMAAASPSAPLNGLLSDPNAAADDAATVLALYQESLIDFRNGVIVSELADSQTPSDQVPNAYLFHLDPRAKWHVGEGEAGKAVTAADVLFTFDRVLDQDLHSPYEEQLRNAMARVESGKPYYSPEEGMVVVISNGQDEVEFMRALIVPIVPEHIWKDVPVAEWATDTGNTGSNPARVVGSGEYRFVERIDHVTCGQEIPPAALDDPDLQLNWTRNSTYRDADPSVLRQWGDYPGYEVMVYSCPRGTQSSRDRVPGPGAVIDVRAHDLPPEFPGGLPVDYVPPGDVFAPIVVDLPIVNVDLIGGDVFARAEEIRFELLPPEEEQQ